MDKQLQGIIDQATNENLSEPDQNLMKLIDELIKSKADKPKQALMCIRKRLMLKNGKLNNEFKYLFKNKQFMNILNQSINKILLKEYTVMQGELSYHTQIASKDFLQHLSQLLNMKDLPIQIKNRIYQLIAIFHQKFYPSRDLLPLFFEFYNHLKSKGAEFPVSESKYGKFQISGQKTNLNSKDKTSKAKAELAIVQQNLDLTNEILDALSPNESVQDNDILIDLVNTFINQEKKLQQFIENIGEQNEELMILCLQLNDEMNLTLQRYKQAQKGQILTPIIKKQQIKSPEKSQKIVTQNLDDFGNFGKQGNKSKQVNLLDDDDQPQIINQNSNPVDLFELEVSNKDFQQQPKQTMQNISNITSNIQNLYIQPQNQESQVDKYDCLNNVSPVRQNPQFQPQYAQSQINQNPYQSQLNQFPFQSQINHNPYQSQMNQIPFQSQQIPFQSQYIPQSNNQQQSYLNNNPNSLKQSQMPVYKSQNNLPTSVNTQKQAFDDLFDEFDLARAPSNSVHQQQQPQQQQQQQQQQSQNNSQKQNELDELFG